jgi:hypothetical protein
MNPKTIVTSSVVLGGLLLAYDTWFRTPGDKAVIGDVVRVPAEKVAGWTAVAPTGLPAGSFVYLLVTAIDYATGSIRGILKRLQLPTQAIEVSKIEIPVTTNRSFVLPLSYGAKPVPVTTV